MILFYSDFGYNFHQNLVCILFYRNLVCNFLKLLKINLFGQYYYFGFIYYFNKFKGEFYLY